MKTYKVTQKTGVRVSIKSDADIIKLLNKKITIIDGKYIYADEYKRASNRDYNLATVDENGNIQLNEENWQKVEKKLQQFKNAGVISAHDYNVLITDVRTKKNELKAQRTLNTLHRRGNVQSFDITSLKSALSMGKAAKFIYNMGLTPEEVAAEYNIPTDELLNDANWDKDIWTGFTNNGNVLVLQFTFDYNGMNNITILASDEDEDY